MLGDSETMYCDICAQNGKTSKIKVYQINFEEATKICENEKCTYPFGLQRSTAGAIINRKYTDIANLTKKKESNQQSSAKKHAVAAPSGVVSLHQIPPKPVKLTNISKILAPYIPGKSSILEKKSVNLPQSAKNLNGTPKASEAMENTTQKSFNNISDRSQDNISNLLTDDRIFKSLNLGDQLMYPQWQNKDALCWLDVVMCLFVHCKTFERFVDTEKDLSPSVLVTLVKAYKQALYLFNSSSQTTILTCKQTLSKEIGNDSLQKCSVEPMDVDASCPEGAKLSVCKEVVGDFKRLSVDENQVKTGAGFQVIDSDFLSIVAMHGDTRYAKGLEALQNVRESTWKSIQPKLRCKKGQNDSPVFAIPLLIKENKRIEKLFTMSYSFILKCKHCGHTKTDHYDKVLPTFPNTSQDFHMSAPAFTRPCFHCEKPNQQRVMVYEKLSEIVMLYFVEGLPHNNFEKLDFSFQGNQYTVTGLIQYRNDPDHFVAWIRDPKENLWMECDDLKSPVTRYQKSKPNIPASQIHVVMWEIQKSDTISNPSNQQKLPDRSTKIISMFKCDTDSKKPLATGSKTESSVVQSNVSMDKVGNGVIENKNSCEQNTKTVANNFFLTLTSSGQLVPLASQGPLGNSAIYPISLVPQGQVNNNVKLQVAENVKSLAANPSEIDTAVANQNGNKYATKSVVVLEGGMNVLKSSLAGQNVATIPVFNPQTKLTNRKTVKDNLLSKTKNNVSFLRSIKQKRAKQETCARNMNPSTVAKPEASISNGSISTQSSSLKTSASESSLFSKMSVSNSHNTSTRSGFNYKGKVFEGYKSRIKEDSQSSRASSPVSVCSSSRCSSPALSTSSDGVVVQKRKTEVSVKNGWPKRRKSEAKNCLTESMLGKDSTGVSDVNSECQVLHGLYSALNITLPEKSLSNVSTSTSDCMSKDDLPEVLELTQFIGNDDNCMTDIDDFLAQL